MKNLFSGKATIPSFLAAALCLAAFWFFNPSEAEVVPESSGEVQVQYSFRSEELLKNHFEKHGIEMGFENEEAYAEGANQVINNPASLHKLEKEDGDDVYYLEDTNEFVIVSTDGYIRTYFYPSSGIDYYNRQ